MVFATHVRTISDKLGCINGIRMSACGCGWRDMIAIASNIRGPHSLECGCLTVNCSVDDVVEVDGMHC